MVLIIGSHANRKSETFKSIGDALNGEKKIGGNVMQIFLGSNVKTTLSEKMVLEKDEIKEIRKIMKKNKIKLVIHGILTLNFCSPISARYKWNIDNLVYDLELNEKLGGLGVVIHMGTYKTFKFDLTYEEGIKNYIKNLIETIKRTKTLKSKIILETSCNQKNKVGGTLEKFAKLYKKVPKKYKDRIGICVDTAHIFSAGYEIHTVKGMKEYWEKFDKLIGIKNCTLIHLNDSRAQLCSCIDRHETLGVGEIFSEDKASLKILVNLAKKHSIPMVLETREKYFKDEIKLVKSLALKGGGYKKDIKPTILDIFERMYDYLQTSTDNKSRFKGLAYRKAINSLKNTKKKIYNGNDVKDLPGFGKSMIEKVNEISETGKLKELNLLNKDPNTQIKKEFQTIMGVGPKIANKWVNQLKLRSIKDLKKAIQNGKVKSNPLLTLGIKYAKNLQTRIPRKELETGAGCGTECLTKIEDLGAFYHSFDEKVRERMRICIDTCHVFSAGYDLRNEECSREFVELVGKHIGWENIALIHLNDSKCLVGSCKDRHENLLKGHISKECSSGLEFFVKFCYEKRIPIVMETPVLEGVDSRKEEMELLNSWVGKK